LRSFASSSITSRPTISHPKAERSDGNQAKAHIEGLGGHGASH
jgi:hypothetical protein